MRRMKRRRWLRAAPLPVFLPAGIGEAMERAFLQAQSGVRIRRRSAKVTR
jgi:hypothetical protein